MDLIGLGAFHKDIDMAVVKMTRDELVRRYADGERDFQHIDFIGADLSGLTLSEAIFDHADMTNVVFCEPIKNTNGATCHDASFDHARMERVTFGDSDFVASSFTLSNMRSITAVGGRFDNCNFDRASMIASRLVDCKCVGVLFTDVDARRSKWSDCDLRESNWNDANMSGSLIAGCDLSDEEEFAGTVWNACTFARTKAYGVVLQGNVESLGACERDYTLNILPVQGCTKAGASVVVVVGCRVFNSLYSAIRHFDSAYYPELDRGEWRVRQLRASDAHLVHEAFSSIGSPTLVQDDECMYVEDDEGDVDEEDRDTGDD